MSKLGTLLKLNFKALLSAIKLGNNKKSRFTGIGAVVFLAFIAIYISGVYSFMFGDILSKAGMLDSLIPLMAILSFVMTIVMTVSSASGFVFSNRDSDLMLSLPVSAFSVMLSKIMALYLECFIFGALFVLPSGVAYIVYGGAWDAGFIIRLVLSAVFLPVLSTLFCVILGWLLAWITAHAKRKSLVSSIVMFAFLAAVFYFSFRLNGIANMLVTSNDSFLNLIHTWLYPFGLMQTGVISSWLDIILFCVICAAPFFLVVWLFSTRYKKILSGLASHDVSNDYKLKEVKTNKLFPALFKKECRRYFGTTIYLFNTGIGSILIIGLAVYAVIAKAQVMPSISQMGGVSGVLPILMLVMGFCLSLTNTTCVSISLEGKTLWILKESPVPAGAIFKSKAAVNLLMTWPPIIIAMAVLSVGYGVDAVEAILMTLAMLVFSLSHSLFGLIVNLHFPKMDCDNDTIIVKQSASAFFGYFGGMVPIALLALLYYFFGSSLTFSAFVAICAAVFLLSTVYFWRRLSTWGAQKLIEL